MKTFFISSTFKDMQVERDILHEQIFPRLRTLIKSYGEDVQEVDLRWGVDTVNMSEEESGHEVLRICIDAIDRCKPFMIVLLGERYGWIPGETIVDSARDQRISDCYEQEMSITELEIQYGALLNDESFDNCVFCFRDSGVLDQIDAEYIPYYCTESPLHARRLTALKNQIRARKNAIILEYSAEWDSKNHVLCGLDSFAQQVYLQLELLIRKKFEGHHPVSLMERQEREIALIRDGYLASYARRYLEEFWISEYIVKFQRYNLFRTNRKTNCLLVCGDAGSGKSALMAYMAENAPTLRDKPIVCFAAASGCRDVPSLKRYIAYSLETILSEPHIESPDSLDEHLRTLDKKAEERMVVCFVDGLDQIYQGERDPYLDLPALCPSLFWVFSALPDFPFDRAAAGYTYNTVHVGRLLATQREELITRTAQKRGKKLDKELVEIISSNKGAHNPLFLSMVMQRLFMMNNAEFEAAEALAPGMEGLHRYMQELLNQLPDMPYQMAVYILDTTARLFDQGQFSEVLMLIASSYNGLTEKELEGLLKLENIQFVPIKFQQIVSYLYNAFDQRGNGKWVFQHRLFRDAVLEGMSAADQLRIRKLLADYSLADDDFLRQEGFRYLLAQKSEAFAGVLEEVGMWQNKAEVSELTGTSARENADIREFLIQLVKDHPSDSMAAFWLEFEEFLYGEDVSAMVAEIVRLLFEAPVSNTKKWRLALRCIYDADNEESLTLLEQADVCAQTLQEPERTVAMASIQAALAESVTQLRRPYDEVRSLQNKSIAYVDRAIAMLDAQAPWKRYVDLIESLKRVVRNAIAWYDPEADKMALHALELLESINYTTPEQEDDYIYYKVLFLYELCGAYRKKPWRNYEKAKYYGKQAVDLAEIAASQRPTIRNLITKYNAIISYTDITDILKDKHTRPYRKRLVDCARQIYAAQETDMNKRRIAIAEAEYGLICLKTGENGTGGDQAELREEAIQHLDHSALLFEELIDSNYPQSQIAVYAAFLTERVELRCDRPEKSLEYGLRAVELITQQQQIAEKTDSDIGDFHDRQVKWCIGWMSRVKTAMATVYLDQLDYENCLRYAREGLALSRIRAQSASTYYSQVLTCALFIAHSCYGLRRDSDALVACDEARNILDDLQVQDSSREPMDAELLYIRGRIALGHGDTDTAWACCQGCISRKKTELLYNKVLILKADCLEAMGDAQSGDAWREALQAWRKVLAKENKQFRSISERIPSLNQKPQPIHISWRTKSQFTLPAYYMAYCYHHYVTGENQLRESWDIFERKVLLAVYFQGKGYLKGRMPYGMKEETLSVYSGREVADCTDFQSLVSSMESMTHYSGSQVDPAIFQLILKNIDKFPDTVPDRNQFDVLNSIAESLYGELLKERRNLSCEKQECDLLQELFQLDNNFPVCKITGDFEGDRVVIWPRAYAESSSDRWYALLKLLLLLLRCDSVWNKSNFSEMRSAYRVVSGQIGGSEEIEKADVSFLSCRELEVLLSAYGMENELQSVVGNKYWYALKNIWTAELYRRSGNPECITRRVQELHDFLTEPYEQMYQQLNRRNDSDMPTEIVQAVKHLVRTLNERDGAQMALPVIRWVESVPELADKLNPKTLFSVQVFNETDRLWLEEVKLRYCRQWLNRNGSAMVYKPLT